MPAKYTRYAWLLLGCAFLALSLGTRLVPDTRSDRGIYISMAERLLAGDILYKEVYDNKDPLFYYLVAAQRLASPFGEYLFELAMVVLSAISVLLIARTQRTSERAAVIAACVTPLVVTGTFWSPGLTHLPATALSLLAAALFLCNRPFPAGVTTGIVLFTKAIVAPLPIVFCLTVAAFDGNTLTRWPRVMRAALGFLLVVSIVVVVLIWRHELTEYLATQVNNVQHAQGILVDGPRFPASLITHLDSMFLHGARQAAIALATIIVAVAMLATSRQETVDRQRRAFAYAIVAVLVLSVLVLGLTGIWDHHLQILYFANSLLLVPLAAWVSERCRSTLVAAGAMTLCAVLLSGTLDPRTYLGNPLDFGRKLATLRTLSPETVALLGATGRVPVAYARIGQNDDRGHAFGLAGYRLACPEFHQYASLPPDRLRWTLDCAAGTPYLIVAESVRPWPAEVDWLPAHANRALMKKTWDAYVEDVEAVLARDYACRTIEGSAARICRRRDP